MHSTGTYVNGGDLSFCQFQGFRFWFQHQGDGEEDEEEKGSSKNHHNVGVPEHSVDGHEHDVDMIMMLIKTTNQICR